MEEDIKFAYIPKICVKGFNENVDKLVVSEAILRKTVTFGA